MKATGIVRKVDQLGRIVLPVELRNVLELEEGTPMAIYTEGESIIIKKYQPTCVFCGETDGAQYFKGKLICKCCRDGLRG